MKILTTVNRLMARSGMLAVLAFVLLNGVTRAATVRMQTRVPGYTGRGDGWVLVLPELRYLLGGKVYWDNARGCYITDRVARDETMRISILPSTATERCTRIALEGIAPGNQFYIDRLVLLPYVISNFKVSTNPFYDNVYINAVTFSGLYSWRIPIGSR